MCRAAEVSVETMPPSEIRCVQRERRPSARSSRLLSRFDLPPLIKMNRELSGDVSAGLPLKPLSIWPPPVTLTNPLQS
jgi:hypothetical protein